MNRKDEQAQGSELSDQLSAAIALIQGTAFDLIEKDPHQWSSRPCPTCIAISALIHRPFGCEKRRK